MKLLTLLLSLMFLLGACGEETAKNGQQQKEDYRYVEIEECMIPIPKRFKKVNQKYSNKTIFFYIYETKKYKVLLQSTIKATQRYKDDYIDMKNYLIQNKNTILKAEYTKNHFKILEWSLSDPVLEETHYKLFGPKTKISLVNSNKTELNYLLDYCKKTWKLDKEKEN